MKKLVIIVCIGTGIFLAACGGGAGSGTKDGKDPYEPSKSTTANGNPDYDPKRGEGKFTKVDVSPNLDATMAASGEKVYGVKCSSCHKLTEEKLVGPGWSGVTKKLTAEWIMNFATNPDVMIDKDPEAQAQLAICLVRMPNQNLTDDEARHIYEFMRKNDGVK